MFSCCALFNTDDNEMDDMEHLKALEELEMESAARLSMTVDNEGGVDAKDLNLEVTPMTASLEMSTGTTEAPKFASLEGDPMVDGDTLEMKLESTAMLLSQQQEEHQQKDEKAATGNKGAFFANEQGDLEARATAASSVDVSKAEEAGAGLELAKAEMVAADANVEIAGETLCTLREAEDAAYAAAAEAEKRRFEEEASARAAREAESEARKALWRAEEAQRMKEKGGRSSPSEPMITTAVVKGEKAAPVASREREEEAARSVEAAREYVAAQLLNAKGLRLLKHGRNGRSNYRKLISPDGDCRTISWGKESHDLKTMQEVRKGTDDDPAFPGFKGTLDLRKSKTAGGAMDRSFSLVFSSRSLDFTADSMEECDKLIQGFRALSAKAQQG